MKTPEISCIRTLQNCSKDKAELVGPGGTHLNPSTWETGRKVVSSRLVWATEGPVSKQAIKETSKQMKQQKVGSRVVVVHTFNPRIWEAEAGGTP